MRWYIILSEYDFELKHRSATQMKHPDALSRFPVEHSEVTHYLSPSLQGEEYVPIIEIDQWQEAMQKSQLPKEPSKNSEFFFEYKGNFLYKRKKGDEKDKKLWVPPSLRNYILRIFHDAPSAGHIGGKRMLQNMNTIWWNGMADDVTRYISTCATCQKMKLYDHRTPMTNKPIPARCLEEISMDLVGPVPYSGSGTRYVLVMQDRLSRFIVFAPMSDATASTVARKFLSQWVSQYGVPRKIVTDRGTNFMSTIFEELCKFMGTKHSPTTAYRPQGNAQNERTHRELHNYIAMYLTPATRTSWDLLLLHAAWVHNSSPHTVLGRSPFEVLTGQKPRNAQALLEVKSENDVTFEEYFDMKLKDLKDLQDKAKESIAKAHATSLEVQNKSVRYPKYYVGQQVLIKTHPLSFNERKWGAKFSGPAVVLEVISPQVLKIGYRDDAHYSDIVHCSYIRPYKVRDDEEPIPGEESRIEDPLIIEDETKSSDIVPENQAEGFVTPEYTPEKAKETSPLSPMQELVRQIKRFSLRSSPEVPVEIEQELIKIVPSDEIPLVRKSIQKELQKERKSGKLTQENDLLSESQKKALEIIKRVRFQEPEPTMEPNHPVPRRFPNLPRIMVPRKAKTKALQATEKMLSANKKSKKKVDSDDDSNRVANADSTVPGATAAVDNNVNQAGTSQGPTTRGRRKRIEAEGIQTLTLKK